MPKSLQSVRRYLFALFGFAFLIIFSSGFFMNLYYLFCLAALALYQAIFISYGKPTQSVTITPMDVKSRYWLLTDVLLLNIILMSLHYDRFVLDAWRFIQFERTFTYAYDAENFFTYPFFLF
jgi:hypothetical protein